MKWLAQIGIVASACAASLLFTAGSARACGGWECTDARYFPSGTVPANLPGFYWWPSQHTGNFPVEDGGAGSRSDAELLALLRFARVDGAKPELLEVELEAPQAYDGPYLIVPKQPLVVGAKYVLWDATYCGADAISDIPPGSRTALIGDAPAFVTVAAAAPLPDQLGTLNAAVPIIGPIDTMHGSSCTEKIDLLYSEVSVAHDASAKPWRDALFYETTVDGESFAPYGDYNEYLYSTDLTPGASRYGAGLERVYVDCAKAAFFDEGVAEGAHRAQMLATIPGTDLKLQTNEVKFTLSCSKPGHSGTPFAGGAVPAAESTRGGAAAGSGAAASTNDDGPTATSDGGCNVAQGNAGGSAWPLVLALTWLRRRRAGSRRAWQANARA